MERLSTWQRIKNWYERYERHISSGAVIFGFVVDNLTLQRIDLLFENVNFLIHLSIIGIGIVFSNIYEAKIIRGKFFGWMHSFLYLVIQFSFGALFSGFFVFYSRSGTIAGSWVFFLLLLGLLVGNELFRKRYARLSFQISIYFIAIFSYTIFSIPVALGKMGAFIFLLSGLVSLFVIYWFVRFIFHLIPQRRLDTRGILILSIGAIYTLINILYFTNTIPPVPLSLKHVGVYHSVIPEGNGVFKVQFESREWYEKFKPYEEFHWHKGESVYILSSVFAPTNLNAEVVHDWQYYSEDKKEWVSVNKIKYPIYGGKSGGYSGYSYKQGVFPGKWRVDIETERGQLVGRKKFVILDERSDKPLENAVR